MIGGIDSIVDKKVDANRANPQRLEQSYSRNKELLDLLALQKLKSEKDAAARDMQMKAEQMPGTIAEQMEKEMLEQTKNDMVEQTAGIMDQRRQKAAAQAKQMGQPPQRPAGIAGMAPQGMPGFQSGGSVSNKALARIDVDDVRQAIQEGKLTKAMFDDFVDSLPAGRNKSEVVEFLETQHSFVPAAKTQMPTLDDPDFAPSLQPDLKSGIGTIEEKKEEEEKPKERGFGPLFGSIGSALAPNKARRRQNEYKSKAQQLKQNGASDAQVEEILGPYPSELNLEAGRLGALQLEAGMDNERTRREQGIIAANNRRAEGISDDQKYMDDIDAEIAALTKAKGDEVAIEDDTQIAAQTGMTTGGGSIADMGGAGVLRKQEAGQQAGPQAGPEPSGIAAAAVTELDPTEKAAADLDAVSDTRVTDALKGTGVSEFIKEGMGKTEADMATARDDEELRLALKYGRLKEDPKNPGKYIKGDTIARMDKYTSDYEKMMGEVQDPEKQRFERSQAQLRGIGRGGAGGGATGIAAERRRQEGERERVFLKRVELDKASIDKNAELIGKEIAAGADVYKSIKEDKRAAATLAMNLGKANLERYDAQYKQILDAASATIKNQLTAQANEIDRQYKMSMIKSADSKTLAALYGGLAAQRKAIGEVITKMYDNVDVPPTAKALEVAITQAIEDANIPAIEKAIIARISTLSGVPLAEAEQQIGDEKEFEDLTGNVMDQLRAMAN